MNVLDLCSGIGGLALGLRLVVPDARTVCYVEREAFCCEVLATQMEAGRLDPAPVWTDLGTFDGVPWRGAVDLVTAGFPCQPFSAAGKRLGTRDDRWLWPHIARILREVRPTLVFLENVPGLVRRGLAHVLATLAEEGFAAEWDLFSAGEVGAPYLRRRIFVLAAHPDRGRREVLGHRRVRNGDRPARWRDADRCGGPAAPDTEGKGLPQRQRQRQAGDQGSEPRSLAGSGARMWWASEPCVRVLDDGTPTRVDELRALGNGVVPLAVAHAFRTLAARIIGGDAA